MKYNPISGGKLKTCGVEWLINFEDSILKLDYSWIFQKILYLLSQNFALWISTIKKSNISTNTIIRTASRYVLGPNFISPKRRPTKSGLQGLGLNIIILWGSRDHYQKRKQWGLVNEPLLWSSWSQFGVSGQIRLQIHSGLKNSNLSVKWIKFFLCLASNLIPYLRIKVDFQKSEAPRHWY